MSNFINKIIFGVVQDRLEGLRSKLISSNLSDFVKRTSIIENVLQTQEIVTNIRKRGKHANVIIKLDVTSL